MNEETYHPVGLLRVFSYHAKRMKERIVELEEIHTPTRKTNFNELDTLEIEAGAFVEGSYAEPFSDLRELRDEIGKVYDVLRAVLKETGHVHYGEMPNGDQYIQSITHPKWKYAKWAGGKIYASIQNLETRIAFYEKSFIDLEAIKNSARDQMEFIDKMRKEASLKKNTKQSETSSVAASCLAAASMENE